jgi:hypothetical protein
MKEHCFKENGWYIAKRLVKPAGVTSAKYETNETAFHAGEIEKGLYLATGMEDLEVFDSEEKWLARKKELGIA